jgi:hypothetical protein
MKDISTRCAPPSMRTNSCPSSEGKASRAPRRAPPERVDGLAAATGQVPRWLQLGQGWFFQATRVKLRGGYNSLLSLQEPGLAVRQLIILSPPRFTCRRGWHGRRSCRAAPPSPDAKGNAVAVHRVGGGMAVEDTPIAGVRVETCRTGALGLQRPRS